MIPRAPSLTLLSCPANDHTRPLARRWLRPLAGLRAALASATARVPCSPEIDPVTRLALRERGWRG